MLDARAFVRWTNKNQVFVQLLYYIPVWPERGWWSFDTRWSSWTQIFVILVLVLKFVKLVWFCLYSIRGIPGGRRKAGIFLPGFQSWFLTFTVYYKVWKSEKSKNFWNPNLYYWTFENQTVFLSYEIHNTHSKCLNMEQLKSKLQ